MGPSTFLAGLLPGDQSLRVAAPIILVGFRMVQGLALGGDYGGAPVYVAEHAPQHKRGYYTSLIQTTAKLGLLWSLVVIPIVQGYVNGSFPDQPELDAAGMAPNNPDGTSTMTTRATGGPIRSGSRS